MSISSWGEEGGVFSPSLCRNLVRFATITIHMTSLYFVNMLLNMNMTVLVSELLYLSFIFYIWILVTIKRSSSYKHSAITNGLQQAMLFYFDTE